MITITIDGKKFQADEGISVLEAARRAEIYIPSLCSHPDLPPFRNLAPVDAVYHGDRRIEGEKTSAEKLQEEEGCKLCLVLIKGMDGLQTACTTPVADGMAVITDSPEIKERRRKNLMPILAKHPHACLTCAQKEGCSREPCSTNVPLDERCCPLLGRCELQKVAEYVGVKDETTRYVPARLPVVRDEPLFVRDYNLCIGCTRCVRACREVRGINALGFVYSGGRFVVGTVAPTLAGSGCKFCTACVEVCPTGALTDKDVSVAEREKDLLPCKASCPAGIDVPGYLRLIAEKKYGEAAALIREKVPFPATLGRVCFHPCERECRRGEVNEPIAICALKGYAADRDDSAWKKKIRRAANTGKKVAVIGAGPAGLTAAYYLAAKGHRPVVFEAAPEAGGMLRYGIPEYRLPADVLKKEIDAIVSRGVEIRTNSPANFESLDGFDAVLIAAGAGSSRRLNVPGSDAPGVLWGVEFLKQVRMGASPPLGGKVIVVGGGNVAVDVAMTARRLGAKDVQLVCLESPEEMPAYEWELNQAREEGIGVNNRLGPKKIEVSDGKIRGISFIRCTSVFDGVGKFAPKFDEGETKFFEADNVIFAIGQQADLGFLGGPCPLFSFPPSMTSVQRPRTLNAKVQEQVKPAGGGAKITDGKRIIVKNGAETPLDGVFAAGDVTGGGLAAFSLPPGMTSVQRPRTLNAKAQEQAKPASVIDAIAAGRRAAAAIDRHLGGDGDIDEKLVELEEPSPYLGRDENFAEKKRSVVSAAPPNERCRDFRPIEDSLSEEAAIAEASRCLQCDLRLKMRRNVPPPDRWLELNAEAVEAVPEIEGVYVLADEKKKVTKIAGVRNLRQALREHLESADGTTFFSCEEDPMYTKRESELIQQHLQQFGEMPGAGKGDLDDLF